MEGDGIIKVILKFVGTGIEKKYQAHIKIYCNNKKIIDSKTYNGEICLLLEKNKIYRLKATFLNEVINTNFYTNSNFYLFRFNSGLFNNSIVRTITLSLKDYYYNIPIEKGKIILWQK